MLNKVQTIINDIKEDSKVLVSFEKLLERIFKSMTRPADRFSAKGYGFTSEDYAILSLIPESEKNEIRALFAENKKVSVPRIAVNELVISWPNTDSLLQFASLTTLTQFSVRALNDVLYVWSDSTKQALSVCAGVQTLLQKSEVLEKIKDFDNLQRAINIIQSVGLLSVYDKKFKEDFENVEYFVNAEKLLSVEVETLPIVETVEVETVETVTPAKSSKKK